FTSIDHRNEYAPRSGVQSPVKPLNTVVRNTNERGTDTGIRDDSDHISHQGGVLSAVLHIHQEPVKAKSSHDACRRCTGNTQPGTQRRLTLLELLLDVVCAHCVSFFLASTRDCEERKRLLSSLYYGTVFCGT